MPVANLQSSIGCSNQVRRDGELAGSSTSLTSLSSLTVVVSSRDRWSANSPRSGGHPGEMEDMYPAG